MNITEEQLQRIELDLNQQQIVHLKDSLLDHLCCLIENSSYQNFEDAYSEAVASFGLNGLQHTESEIHHLIKTRKEITMKKTMYVFGFLAIFISVAGALFKVMHWPGAHIQLVLGACFFNFGWLPLYFYGKYRDAVATQ